MAVGLEVAPDRLRVVTVTDQGEVMDRADRPTTGDLARALRDALRARRPKRSDPTAHTGVALPWPPAEVPPEVTAVIADSSPAALTIGSGAATALAEAWCGAARDARDVIAIAITEHVTAGLVVAGEVVEGAHGYAGSIAWLALNPVERADYRRFGGLDAEVSAAGIVRRAIWRIKSGDLSMLTEVVAGDLSRLTATQVLDAALAGDGVAIAVVRDTVRYVGMAVSNMAAVVDPEVVVLGGLLASSSGRVMLDAIRSECSRRLQPAQADRVKIVLSILGADAPAIGAARAAILRRR